MLRSITIIVLLLCTFSGFAQVATLEGRITDQQGVPVFQAAVGVPASKYIVTTDSNGYYKLEVPAGQDLTIIVQHISFERKTIKLNLMPGEKRELNHTMDSKSFELDGVEKFAERDREKPMSKIDVSVADFVPSVTGGVERQILSQGLGTSSNNELSSQYSVRGGNFDENLIYVNGIEVYRPFLIRNGQQEGLSFVNTDLVDNVSFSSGGFEAKYGDKMSSVLDIEYKKPEHFAGSVSAGLLGANVHLENSNKTNRFTQIHGFRYFTNQYLLGSLDEQGEYRPRFLDYQTYLTYGINDEWEVAFLGNVSQNQYQFVPENRTSSFGTVSDALSLNVFFDGSEVNEFLTGFGALSTTWKPRLGLKLEMIASGFRSIESETFDIEGAYRLSELETDLSKESFGDEAFVLGTGSYLNHARNYLDASVFAFEHKGEYQPERHKWLWGLKYRRDDIRDAINEWEVVDSVGFSVPYDGEDVALFEVIQSDNHIATNRLMGYLQRDWYFDLGEHSLFLGTGIRFHYWDLNYQTTVSPRVQASFRPDWKQDWIFRASWGYYHQPAFYREMRDLTGNVNPEIRAQTSIHYLVGTDHNFKAWNRKFKFVGEAYYKQLEDLIPYELDNVRIRYYADNNAKGYATGLDLKLNGEFVKGVESWVSFSLLKTEEDLLNDFFQVYFNEAGDTIVKGVTADQSIVDSTTVYPGFIPRPTDQLVTFALTFQDYIPGRENFKMHLSLLFGSGLPTGPPSYTRYKDIFRMPQYRRVDIGFSFQLKSPENDLNGHFMKVVKSAWISLEVFNLLAINNTISYLWVKDSRNIEYGVPNYLTQRRVNAKLIVAF